MYANLDFYFKEYIRKWSWTLKNSAFYFIGKKKGMSWRTASFGVDILFLFFLKFPQVHFNDRDN